MSETNSLEITFDNCTQAEAAQLANLLEQDLREAAETEIRRKKDRADSQDFGSTIVLLFGTPVAIALAKAVSGFLQRNSGATIRISRDGEVVGTCLDSKDAARIAEAFAGKKYR